MIAVCHTSACFKTLARYLETPKKHRENTSRVEWTETRNLVCTDTMQDIAWEMTVVARGSGRVQKPVYHLSISWAPEDDPTRDQMVAISDQLRYDLSLKDHQALLVAHGDEQYQHVHIMANRVHPETRRAVSTYRDYYTLQATMRHAEVDYGFRRVPSRLYKMPDLPLPDRSQSISKGAYKALQRGKVVPFQILVQQVAAQDLIDAKNWYDLKLRLAHHGLSMKRQKSGLVVTDGHEYTKCSSIAPGVSMRRLEERFGQSFTLERPALERGLQKQRGMGR